MKKIYTNPEFQVAEVNMIDCLAVSQSVLPENPIPDVTVPGGSGGISGGDGFIW